MVMLLMYQSSNKKSQVFSPLELLIFGRGNCSDSLNFWGAEELKNTVSGRRPTRISLAGLINFRKHQPTLGGLTRPNQPTFLSTTTFPPIYHSKTPFDLAAGRPTPPSTRQAADVVLLPGPPRRVAALLRRHDISTSRELESLKALAAGRQKLAPDAYSSGFSTHPTSPMLLPLSPPRRAAARIALTRRIDVPRAGLQLRGFGCRQADTRPRSIKQRVLQLFSKTFVVVAAAAPRSGAIALTRRIAVRRASILLGESFPIVTSDLRVSRTSMTIRIDVPRAGCFMNKIQNFPAARPFSTTQAQNQNSISELPPTNARAPYQNFSFRWAAPIITVSPNLTASNLQVLEVAENFLRCAAKLVHFCFRCAAPSTSQYSFHKYFSGENSRTLTRPRHRELSGDFKITRGSRRSSVRTRTLETSRETGFSRV
ncbi:hypothetical protein R3P38DRAFT_3424157 [Favolaschia claudopus]|uniref:Uncharacterized protein n=1 Tax=Favolaschia claudopus TaxID=2862362 RepID=A0AAV9ZXG2_9AGAR